MSEAARRRSPHWVRAMSDQQVHSLTGKLDRDFRYGNPFSDPQDWLLNACIAELQHRARRDRRDGIKSCVCEWCCGPTLEDEPEPPW